MYDDVVFKGRFVWNRLKAEANQRKHGITFEQATEIFDDPFFIEEYDEENSVQELPKNGLPPVCKIHNREMHLGNVQIYYGISEKNELEHKNLKWKYFSNSNDPTYFFQKSECPALHPQAGL